MDTSYSRTAMALAGLPGLRRGSGVTPRPVGAKRVTKGDIEALKAAESKRERKRLKRLHTGG